MDVTGGLGDAAKALSAQLPGIAEKLIAAGHADEVEALQSAHDTLMEAIGKVQTGIEQPVLIRLDRLIAAGERIVAVAEAFQPFANGFAMAPRKADL